MLQNQQNDLAQLKETIYVDLVVVGTPSRIEEDYPTRKPADLTNTKGIKMDDIFTGTKCRSLLIGAAGVGKSSMSQKLTLDWALEKKWHDKFDYIFHFRCRDLAEQCLENLTMQDLLTSIHSPDLKVSDSSESLIGELMENKNGVLIVLDGLDELPAWDTTARNRGFTEVEFPTTLKTSIADLVNGLISGLTLNGVHVLATTRPMETLSCLRGITSVLILGFSEASVQKCIKNICKVNTSDSVDENYQKLVDFLQSNSTIMNLCAVPFMCTLFTIVAIESLKEQDEINVKNITQLVILAIRHLVTRRKAKNNLQSDGNIQWEFTDSQRLSILRLSAMAANCTLRDKLKIIFTQSDVNDEGEVDTGLLECFKEQKMGKKPQIYYSFNHLLVQEFLTALHVCLNKDAIRQCSRINPNSQRLDNVHLFMAGLLGDKDLGHGFIVDIKPDVENLMTIQELLPVISSQGDNSKLKKLQLIRCAHEGQMSDMMGDIRTLVMEEDGKTLDLREIPGGLLPHHLASVGWFIQESQCLEDLR